MKILISRSLGILALVAVVGLVALPGLTSNHQAYAQDSSGAQITAPGVPMLPWSDNTPQNDTQVTGHVTFDGQSVVGARVMVNGYKVPQPTASDGSFVFPANRNSVTRYVVKVYDTSNATINGQALSQDQQTALQNAEGGINVYYTLRNLNTEAQSDGTFKVTGQAVFDNGDAPVQVSLYSYRLFGTVTDTSGQPVEGVSVSTRSPEFRWTLSDPTGADGKYEVPFWPNSSQNYRVVVIDSNDNVYQAQGTEPTFAPLVSAEMDITMDQSSQTITFTQPQNNDGIVYQGVLLGVMSDGQMVQPVSVTWPDAQGNFTLVLPASLAGKTVEWWQSTNRYFSSLPGKPGSEISVEQWPTTPGAHNPVGFAELTLPGG